MAEHNHISLVTPLYRHMQSYLEALDEYHAEGRYLDRSESHFDDVLARLASQSDSAKVETGQVPALTWWLVDDNTYLGRLSLRPELNAAWLESGGHIGYDIRPSARGRGLGTLLLALGLKHASAAGLHRVLLTCHEDNLRSIRVIEANGGVYECSVPIYQSDLIEHRYWIEL